MNNRIRTNNNTQMNNRTRLISTGSARRIRICRIRRNFLISIAAVLLVITGVIIGSSLLASSKANASNEAILYKYYTSIEVQPGDSLWSIADTYRNEDTENHEEYIAELVSMNHLKTKTIHAGDYITVAYYSNEFK